MITVSNAQLGLDMAERLGVREIKLNPVLEKLYQLSVSPKCLEALNKETEWTSITAEDINEATRQCGGDDRVHHDLEMAKLVDMVDRGVSAIMDLTSNTVNPLAKDVIAKIKHEVDEQGYRHEPPKVIPVFVPNFEKISFLEDMLVEDAAPQRATVTLPKDFIIGGDVWSTKTATERMALVQSTNPKLNEFLKTLIEQEDYVTLGIHEELHSPAQAILNYAYVSRLMNNPSEDINMTLAEYNLVLLKARKQYARMAIAGVKTMTRRATSGYLISDIPTNGLDAYAIRVYGETYNKWIAAGGSVEALFGVVHGRLSNMKANDLTNYKHYEKVYQDWKRGQELLMSSNFKEMAHTVVTRELTAWGSSSSDSISPREIEKEVKGVIRSVENPSVVNLERWVRLVIVNSFMANSSIMEFIDEMAEIADKNPDLPIAECAELARLHVIGDWLGSLIV